jgi:hypothetical protein
MALHFASYQTGAGWNVVPGAYHGFGRAAPNAKVSKQFKAALYSALSRAFERKV